MTSASVSFRWSQWLPTTYLTLHSIVIILNDAKPFAEGPGFDPPSEYLFLMFLWAWGVQKWSAEVKNGYWLIVFFAFLVLSYAFPSLFRLTKSMLIAIQLIVWQLESICGKWGVDFRRSLDSPFSPTNGHLPRPSSSKAEHQAEDHTTVT